MMLMIFHLCLLSLYDDLIISCKIFMFGIYYLLHCCSSYEFDVVILLMFDGYIGNDPVLHVVFLEFGWIMG